MNPSENIIVESFMVRRVLTGCAILVIGILYNLYKDANALYDAFTPFDLPIICGQIAVGITFITAILTSIRMFGFLREPLIVKASEEGLFMRGLGLAPWDKIHKIWFGTLLGKSQGFLGTFLFIEFQKSAEATNLNLKSGIYSEKVTKSGRHTKIRYWLPFVFPNTKKQFMEIANLYCPHPNKNWME